MTKKSPTIAEVVKILDHKRAETGWVVRPSLDSGGRPCIVRIARVTCVHPADGAGRLTVLVTDWGDGASEAKHYINRVSGYGYDKFTAATSGSTIGGVELGDHSDPDGRPTFRHLMMVQKWETFNVPGGW